MFKRRDFNYALGTFGLGGLMAAVIAVPGVKYVLDPLRRGAKAGSFRPLARLAELRVGVPTLVPILGERRDAWVKYPTQPVGSVWLVRQPEGSPEPVTAFSAQCPHAGCPIDLGPGAKGFKCPCHNSDFALDGRPLNDVSPRGMDRLEVEKLPTGGGPDAEVKVQFQRFQLGCKEKIPLV